MYEVEALVNKIISNKDNANFESIVKDVIEELNDRYEYLHMTYLSQVSLYKSLYKEELKKKSDRIKAISYNDEEFSV